MGAMGERSKSGPGAEGGGEAILAVTVGEAPVLVFRDAMVDVALKACYGGLAREQGAKNREQEAHGR